MSKLYNEMGDLVPDPLARLNERMEKVRVCDMIIEPSEVASVGWVCKLLLPDGSAYGSGRTLIAALLAALDEAEKNDG